MIEIYDKNNNLIYEQYDNGRWYRCEYDENHNKVYTLYNDGRWYTWEYENNIQCDWNKGQLNLNYPNVSIVL